MTTSTGGLDLTLLKLLRHRPKYERFRRHVPDAVIDQRTRVVLQDFGKYFAQNEGVTEVTPEFVTWFKLAHPKLGAEAVAVYDQQFRAMMQPLPEGVEAGLLERLITAETAHKVGSLLTEWDDGAEVDMYAGLRTAVENHEAALGRKVRLPWVQDDIKDLLADDMDDRGFHWRLDCLNDSMRGLRGGDFGVVAGRPDKGKTTFATSELTHFAPQVEALYPGEKRSILWLNNEGPGKRIKTRLYQSALNCTIPELVDKMKAGTVEDEYAAAVGGDPNIIKIMDIHDYWSHEVEDIVKHTPPALVLFDMVDNIRFGGDVGNNGQRTDQLLEAMYQWARILSVKNDCVALATSQISADGDGVPYPTLSMLKDSKTGKQGAAEFIITLGASNDPALANSRFIGSTKNKLHRFGGKKDPRCEVIFDGQRGRYVMPS